MKVLLVSALLFVLAASALSGAVLTLSIQRSETIWQGETLDLDGDGSVDITTSSIQIGHETAAVDYWGAQTRTGVEFLKAADKGYADSTRVIPLVNGMMVGSTPSAGTSWDQGSTPGARLTGSIPTTYFLQAIDGPLQLRPDIPLQQIISLEPGSIIGTPPVLPGVWVTTPGGIKEVEFQGMRTTWLGFRLERDGAFYYGALELQLLADFVLPDGERLPTNYPGFYFLGGVIESDANTPLNFSVASVPEPGRAVLIMLGAFAWLTHRRRAALGAG